MPLRKGQLSGTKNPNWQGGRSLASNGYVLVKHPDHPFADVRGYIYEHRIVAEQILGRPLLPTEEVHHKDKNKQNNDPSNLAIMPSRAHHRMEHRSASRKLRNPGERNPTIACACGCGTRFKKYDSSGRMRRFVSGHNMRSNKDVR